MTVHLRPYQHDLVARAADAFRGGARRVLATMATGGGKGRVLAHVTAGAAGKGRRVLVIAHRSELVDQISANLADEGVAHGRIQASFPLSGEAVQVGMVQSVCRRLNRLQPPDFLLIDECHHATAAQYAELTSAWPNVKVLGVTATPVRTDGKGLSACFDVLVAGPSTRELIDAGHLADYDYFEPGGFDTSGLRTRAGEFVQADALEAVHRSAITGSAVEHYVRHLAGRPAIAFALGVEEAETVARSFREAGIRAAPIDGTMTLEERRRRLDALATGELHVVTAADVISEGVDIPAVSGAILLRPTASLGLHLQQVGRCLRPKPDGGRAIILDHVGNAARHGYPSDPRQWTLDGVERRGQAMRTCSRCQRTFRAEDARALALASCSIAAAAAGCPMQAPPQAGEIRLPPERVEGELRNMRDPWRWAGGIDPVRARGRDWHALLERAQTEAQLRMIARARGFRRGWTQHVLRDRASA